MKLLHPGDAVHVITMLILGLIVPTVVAVTTPSDWEKSLATLLRPTISEMDGESLQHEWDESPLATAPTVRPCGQDAEVGRNLRDYLDLAGGDAGDETDIDRALGYIQRKFNALDYANTHSSFLLRRALKVTSVLRSNKATSDSMRTQVHDLQGKFRSLAGVRDEATAELADERRRVTELNSRLQNATREALLRENTRDRMRHRVVRAQLLGVALQKILRETHVSTVGLQNKLAMLNQTLHVARQARHAQEERLQRVKDALGWTQAEVGRVRIAEAQQNQQVQVEFNHSQLQAKRQEEVKREAVERLTKFAKGREQGLAKRRRSMERGIATLTRELGSSRARELEVHETWREAREAADKRNMSLSKALGTRGTEFDAERSREEQLGAKSMSKLGALSARFHSLSTVSLRSMRALGDSVAEVRSLRSKVLLLRRRGRDAEIDRGHAEVEVKQARDALARVEVEGKELKGSLPWLQAEVEQRTREAKSVAAKVQKAYSARDSARASLVKAQHDISQLEQRYASALQMLVSVQAEDNPSHGLRQGDVATPMQTTHLTAADE